MRSLVTVWYYPAREPAVSAGVSFSESSRVPGCGLFAEMGCVKLGEALAQSFPWADSRHLYGLRATSAARVGLEEFSAPFGVAEFVFWWS